MISKCEALCLNSIRVTREKFLEESYPFSNLKSCPLKSYILGHIIQYKKEGEANMHFFTYHMSDFKRKNLGKLSGLF